MTLRLLLLLCLSLLTCSGVQCRQHVAQKHNQQLPPAKRETVKQTSSITRHLKRGLSKKTTDKQRIKAKSKQKKRTKQRHQFKHRQCFKETFADLPQSKAGNYETLAKSYSFYDRGLTDKLKGDFNSAVSELSEAEKLLDQCGARSVDLKVFILYELGQAAEAQNNFELSKKSYIACLKLKPNLTDAYIKLAKLLTKHGNPLQALSYSKEAVVRNPEDTTAHLLHALLLDKNGFIQEAQLERDKAKALIKGGMPSMGELAPSGQGQATPTQVPDQSSLLKPTASPNELTPVPLP